MGISDTTIKSYTNDINSNCLYNRNGGKVDKNPEDFQ